MVILYFTVEAHPEIYTFITLQTIVGECKPDTVFGTLNELRYCEKYKINMQHAKKKGNLLERATKIPLNYTPSILFENA